MSVKLTQPIKWHGGKHDLAAWIIGLMPPRCQNPNKPDPADPGWLHYVEPYFGGGSVLLANDPEGISEVVNDLHRELTNFWCVLADADKFGHFRRRVEAVPFSEWEWRLAAMRQDNEITKGVQYDWGNAADFFVTVRQSLSGRADAFAGITRNRTRRGMNEQVSAWLNTIEGLPAVHARLKRVLIRNQPALDVIRKEDGPRTLFYLDPPYLHETRATTGEYQYEMTVEQHSELLTALGTIKGRFLLSGYQSKLYDDHAAGNGWTRHEMKINNHASGGKTKRVMTECVWTNYQPAAREHYENAKVARKRKDPAGA
jgi:DNA adenine methylase